MKKFFLIAVLVLGIGFYYFNTIEENYEQKGIINQTNGNNINNSTSQSDSSSNLDNVLDNEDNSIKNINSYKTIKIGESLDSLISKMGKPSKIECSEYPFDWYVYNDNYSKFCMVGIQDKKVVALFSNTMDSTESEGIKLGDTKSDVLSKHKKLNYREIGYTRYMIDNEDYYSLIEGKSSYITVFFDSFNKDKALGIQIISKKVESQIIDIYAKDESITDDFENINRYLINAERVKANLNALSYSEKATLCARSHSKDMRDKDYFAHENLQGKSPFDRMKDYDISYIGAAENIAAGQTSSIFAHYALMNSEGHRVNILGNYKYIGIGVSFGGDTNIYYTQNFYR